MATPVKNSTFPSQQYGAEKYNLEEVLVGAGAAPPTVQPTNDASNPPCAAEIAGVTRSGVGVYVVTFRDAYFAVAFAAAEPDDTANDGAYCTIGNWTNLQSSTPAQCTVRFRTAGGAAAEAAVGRAIRLSVVFKKSYTGATA